MHSQVKKKPAKKKAIKSKKSVTTKDYSSDPFFKKKADDAQAFLEEHGFPKDLISKNSKN